jgi:BirA family transcriptional regulator, biotin operon repressor / biotin---[acetyl-CoA-carboxylase] ligase
VERGGGTGAVLTEIRVVAETGSTNADMLALARAGVAEGVWLRAERQVAGRGRLGREWVSPAGNFHGSTTVRLHAAEPPPATLALVAAVALHEAIASLGAFGRVGQEQALALKWPNDLLLAGAKIAGMLLEREGDAVVVGIGVNLLHHPDLPDRPTTSLAAHGLAITPDVLAPVLADAFARWLSRWRSEGLAPVRGAWIAAAHPGGTALAARLSNGEVVDGLFAGLSDDGALLLRLASGERRAIHAGDVFLL